MRVVLVDPPSYTPPYDHELAAALARRSHEVDLLASRFLFGPVPEPSGYRRHDLFFPLSGRLFHRAPRSRLRALVKGAEYLPSVRRLLRRIDSLEPDIVHVQWLPFPHLDVRWVKAIRDRYPTVFTAHNVVPRRRGARPDRRRKVYALVERVVVHSHRGVDQLAELGVERDRIARIPHPIFAAPPGLPITPPDGKTLLFFGLLRTYKGLDLLVRALGPLSRDVPDVRLVVAGDALDPVEPVQRLAADLGVADRIEWRLEYVPNGEIAPLMQSVTVVVLPYRQTDASGVLATAVGHGRPAVVSDVGSLGEVVREFGAGEVVPPEDVPALAAACARLLRSEDALAAAFRGTQAAREALSWERAAEAHERLYEELLAEPGRGSR